MTIPANHKAEHFSELLYVVRSLLAGDIPHLLPHDWERVAALASRHGVSGFLFKRLQQEPENSGIPHHLLGHMQEEYLANHTLYFRHVACGMPIFHTLTKQGIPFFIYKGISLIDRYYRDPGLRPISDVDLVVHREDIPVVSQILEHHQFIKGEGFGHHFYQDNVCLDVHTDLFRLDRVSTRSYALAHTWEDVWDRLDHFQVQGCSLATLHPIDEFVLLSWHALKHSFSHLKWFIDLSLIYQAQSHLNQFSLFLASLSDDSIRKAAWYVLRLLQAWFLTPISSPMVQAVMPAKLGWLERQWSFNQVLARGKGDYFAEVSLLGSIQGIPNKVKFMTETIRSSALSR